MDWLSEGIKDIQSLLSDQRRQSSCYGGCYSGSIHWRHVALLSTASSSAWHRKLFSKVGAGLYESVAYGANSYLTHQPSLYCLRAEKLAPTLARGWSITLWTDSPLLFSLANRTIHLRP